MVGEACCNPSIRGKPELHLVTNLRPKHRGLTPTAVVRTGAAGVGRNRPEMRADERLRDRAAVRCVESSDASTVSQGMALYSKIH